MNFIFFLLWGYANAFLSRPLVGRFSLHASSDGFGRHSFGRHASSDGFGRHSFGRHASSDGLSKEQWHNINSLLQHPSITEQMREKLNAAIYKNYQSWAFSKAHEFKQFHKHKCKHIPKEELYLYASRGLMHAIKNYNGKNAGNTFTNYAAHYLTGEFYRALTKLVPICNVPESIRKKSKNPEDIQYKTHMDTLFVGAEDWKLENAVFTRTQQTNSPSNSYRALSQRDCEGLNKIIEMDEYRDFWERRIAALTSLERQVFQYKYDFYLNRVRNHREIAEMMGYSEEWIRKTFLGSIEKIVF